MRRRPPRSTFFFFNDTATTEIYTLSLHDALPISAGSRRAPAAACGGHGFNAGRRRGGLQRTRTPHHLRSQTEDRKSTRLNSSHQIISYAVFCLKKKKK